jgi:hypothetical protein
MGIASNISYIGIDVAARIDCICGHPFTGINVITSMVIIRVHPVILPSLENRTRRSVW